MAEECRIRLKCLVKTFFTILCYMCHDFYHTFPAVAYWAAILDAIMQVVAVPRSTSQFMYDSYKRQIY